MFSFFFQKCKKPMFDFHFFFSGHRIMKKNEKKICILTFNFFRKNEE